MATVVVIGGGISGLASAYYLQKGATNIGKVILLEGSRRTGGWMQSVKHEDGSIFEFGPRSLRPVGESGKNTLRLVEELGLTKDILVVRKTDPPAKNRFLYVGGQLCPLPSSVGGILRKTPPFSRPLWKNFMHEPFVSSSNAPDESIHSFVGRRLGLEFADIAVDAMCRGIFANNCRKLSMKSCFPDLFQLERTHGSLIMGMLRSRGAKPETELEKRSQADRWSSWSLRQGLQQLSDSMADAATSTSRCQIRTGSPCLALRPTSDGRINVKTAEEEIIADHVISSIYSKDLVSLLPQHMSELKKALASIPSVSVFVVNLEYLGQQLPFEGFGHLLPSSESPHVLGIVYDSCTFPEHNRKDAPSTRITVMLGGGWMDQMLTEQGELPDEHTVATMAKEAACKQLGFSRDIYPSKLNVMYQKECIPAYTLGHSEKLGKISSLLSKAALPLSLVGSSYRGVSVNDCINNARIETQSLLNKFPAWAEKKSWK